jgi:hypothetical protein
LPFKSIDFATGLVDSITVTPRHHRLGLFGGSFSTTLGSIVIRGEGAYYSGKYFSSVEQSLVDGVVEKNYIHYLLGLDFSLADIKMSLQFIQQTIPDYSEYILNDQFENTMTFLARKDFLRETLFFELFTYIGLNNGDSLVRLKATYNLVPYGGPVTHVGVSGRCVCRCWCRCPGPTFPNIPEMIIAGIVRLQFGFEVTQLGDSVLHGGVNAQGKSPPFGLALGSEDVDLRLHFRSFLYRVDAVFRKGKRGNQSHTE